MKTGRQNGFWSGGADSYDEVLRMEEQEVLKPLQESLQIEPDPEIQRNPKDQIQAIQAEFKKKRKAAGSSLFSGR